MALVFEWQHQFLFSCSQVVLGCSVIAASELGLPGQGFLLARGEGAVEREKHAWGSRAWQSICFGSQGLCAGVFSRWMPFQGCSKDAFAKLKWDALSQVGSIMELQLPNFFTGVFAFWYKSCFCKWTLMGFGNDPCGSQTLWKFSSLSNACWEGEMITSSSSFLLLQGALGSTIGWTLKHNAETFQATTQWLWHAPYFLTYQIDPNPKSGVRSPTVEEVTSFTECAFQIMHSTWKEGVGKKFQKYFVYFPTVKDSETKVLTKILQGEKPNFLPLHLDFLGHHGPCWARLICPSGLQVVKSERAELWSEDILTTPMCKEPPFNRDHLCLGVSHVFPSFYFSSISLGVIEANVIDILKHFLGSHRGSGWKGP